MDTTNRLVMKNRIKQIILARVDNSDANSDNFLDEIANLIYNSNMNIVESLSLAKTELKSPLLYEKLSDKLSTLIAKNIYRSLNPKS
jgi:hypothetical protein